MPKKNAKGLLREFYESGLLTGEVCCTLRLLAQHKRSVRLAAHGEGGPVHGSKDTRQALAHVLYPRTGQSQLWVRLT